MYDGKVVIATELDTKTVDAQINKLEKDLNIMVKSLKTDMQVPVELRMSEAERINLMSDIEKTKNRIISLKESMEDVGNTGNKMNDKISKGFKKGTNSLKKFGLSLFGIHSIYRLVSKASSSYLSQDVELAEKLKSAWTGLGSFFAPVLETISNLLLKGLGYLNVFIKALTGIDYIAKANAKSLNKQAQAQKNLNRQTYDFDEIRKQQEASAGVSGGISSGGIDIPELDSKLVNKLQNLAKWLKENQTLVKALGIALGVTFGAVAIAKLLTNIGNLIGTANAGTGLAGLSSLLGKLSQIGIIAIGVSLLYTGLTGRNIIDDLKEIYSNIQSLKSIEEEQKNAKIKALEESLQLIEATNKALENTENTEYRTNQLLEIKKDNIENIKKYLQDWEVLYSLNEDEIKRVNEALKDGDTTVNDIKKGIYDWTPGINSAKSGFAVFWDGIKSGISDLFGGKSKKTKGYALGGIVTQPTRALIGEAGYPEAVVPMTGDYLSTLASEIGKYSSGGYGGNVNVYLDGRLIQRQMAQTESNKKFTTNGG